MSKIREAIFGQDHLFSPGSNIGCGIESLMTESQVLFQLEPREIETELLAMEAEGLLTSNTYSDKQKYWHSTTKGQIENQRLISASGHRSDAFVNQLKFDAYDLVFGIIAAHRVSSNSSSSMRRHLIPIFLYEIDSTEIDKSVESIIDQEFARTWDTPWGVELHLTVTGLKKYRSTIQKRLGLADDQSVLDAPPKPARDHRIDKIITDRQLADNLQMRLKEAFVCKISGAPLSAVILLGSILEGVLLAVLKNDLGRAMKSPKAPFDKKTSSVKPIDEWKLVHLIEVASDLTFVTTPATKHAHDLRDSRNLVHPQKQITDKIEIDGTLLNISFEVVDAILTSLAR